MQTITFGQIAVPVRQQSQNSAEIACANSNTGFRLPKKTSKLAEFRLFGKTHILQRRSPFSPVHNGRTRFVPMAASSASAGGLDYIEEPSTKVKFQKFLDIPGCSTILSLLGTGYREKVFAIFGVKVYAAGLYANPSISNELISWKENSSAKDEKDSSLFSSLYQSPLDKSLCIVLVRDVDGKTFWDALNEALSPKLKQPTPVDESALGTFKDVFEGRDLKKGTIIYLTWLEPSKMLVSLSSDGVPTELDGTVTSLNVTKALFDVFFGDSPVSPTLKDSVSSTLVGN